MTKTTTSTLAEKLKTKKPLEYNNEPRQKTNIQKFISKVLSIFGQQ